MHKFLQETNRCGVIEREEDRPKAIGPHPSIQLGLVFAALIHDAGHAEIPNDILATEQTGSASCRGAVVCTISSRNI